MVGKGYINDVVAHSLISVDLHIVKAINSSFKAFEKEFTEKQKQLEETASKMKTKFKEPKGEKKEQPEFGQSIVKPRKRFH